MNAKIEELAKQAGMKWPAMGEISYSNFCHEKFAELIVQGCVKILIANEGNENTSDAIWDLEELGVDVNKILDSIGDY